MKLFMSSAEMWKEIMNAVRIVDEVTIRFTPIGIEIKAINREKTAMVVLKLPELVFNEYECLENEVLTINVFNLNQIMKRASNTDTLRIVSDGDKLRIILEKNGVKRTFITKLLSTEFKDLSEPNVDLQVSAKIEPSVLKNAIGDAEIIGNTVIFKCSDNKFYIECEGNSKSVNIDIGKGLLAISMKKESKAVYNLKYLVDIVKSGNLYSLVNVEFSTNLPLRLEYPINGGTLVYWLAPQIEE